MAEGNKDGRSLKDMVADAVEEELSQHPKHTLTPQDLEAMVVRKTQEKHRKVWKIAGAAAVFLIAAIGISIALNAQSLDAEADKPEKEEIVTENGIIIENEGWGSSQEDMLVIDDWAEIDVAKEHMAELLVPGYVPDGYSFEALTVETLEGSTLKAIFSFISQKKERFYIEELRRENNMTADFLNGNIIIYKSKWGKLYLEKNSKRQVATVITEDDLTVNLIGNLSEREFLEIANGLVN